ncbi:hypothetical protein [Janthinobacterium rivuli]|uniref:hypothetical protein n=1 Tax=Janthinobacterium sp. FT68W TaxID=2654255 RepID=UPI00186AC4EA|nr:hypothetical protein [Janthinobacterium sp. FT68W]
MHPYIPIYRMSLDDLLSSMFAALPFDEWLIQLLIIAIGFCVVWVWRKLGHRHGD